MFTICLWLAFYLSAPAVAQDSGSDPPPNDQPVGWQAGDNHRGTWSIISSCLSTIFACTWSVQHPNVPGGPQDSRWSRRLRSFKWMLITILFPELIVLHAIFEFAMALEALRLMELDHGKFVELPWWLPPLRSSLPSLQRRSYLLKRLSHRLLCSSKEQRAADAESQPVEDGSKWTLIHCFFANMGGYYYEGGRSQFPLTALQLAKEREGFERPTITEEEIKDRSKQDWFAKGVVALQFLQLALSLIVRANQGLAFSQLETITLGFAVCGAVIYLFYLYKPQNVETRTPWTVPPRPPYFKKTYDSFWDVLVNEQSHANIAQAKTGEQVQEQTLERIPNDNIPISKNSIAHPGVFLLAFASGLFGAIHAIAWHFEFPSTVEKILWQTATVVAAASPVVGLVAIPFAQLTIAAGDPQLFMRNCLRLMREFSWQISKKDSVVTAYEKLETILITRSTTKEEEQRQYVNVFSPKPDIIPEQSLSLEDRREAVQLGQQLLGFLETRGGSVPLETVTGSAQ